MSRPYDLHQNFLFALKPLVYVINYKHWVLYMKREFIANSELNADIFHNTFSLFHHKSSKNRLTHKMTGTTSLCIQAVSPCREWTMRLATEPNCYSVHVTPSRNVFRSVAIGTAFEGGANRTEMPVAPSQQSIPYGSWRSSTTLNRVLSVGVLPTNKSSVRLPIR